MSSGERGHGAAPLPPAWDAWLAGRLHTLDSSRLLRSLRPIVATANPVEARRRRRR